MWRHHAHTYGINLISTTLIIIYLQDILECRDSMEALNELNEKGRVKLTQLREELENFELYGNDIRDPKYAQKLQSERQQLAR